MNGKVNFFQRSIETLPLQRTESDRKKTSVSPSHALGTGVPIGPRLKNDGKPYDATTVKAGPRKGNPRSTEKLSGLARVSPQYVSSHYAATGRTEVVCQQHSFAFLAQKEYVDQVTQSIPDIESFFNHPGRSPKKIDELVQEIEQMPSEHRHTVGNRGFGKWARDVAKGMEKQDLSLSGGLFCPSTHMMAARIEFKKRDDGSQYICVTGLDTEDKTGIPRRVYRNTPEELEDLTAKDIFPQIREYYNDCELDSLSMAAMCPDVALADPASLPYFEDLKSIADPKSLEIARTEAITIAFTSNIPDSFRAVCADLKADGIVGDAALPYLVGKTRDGLRAMHWVPYKCLPSLLRTLGEEASALGLTGKKALELIRPLFDEVDNRTSRLHMTHMRGDRASLIEILEATSDFMKTCQIEEDDATKVLNCRVEGRHGDTLFGRAAIAGQADVLKTIISIANQHDLGGLNKGEIYDGRYKSPAGWSGPKAKDLARTDGRQDIADLIDEAYAKRWD